MWWFVDISFIPDTLPHWTRVRCYFIPITFTFICLPLFCYHDDLLLLSPLIYICYLMTRRYWYIRNSFWLYARLITVRCSFTFYTARSAHWCYTIVMRFLARSVVRLPRSTVDCSTQLPFVRLRFAYVYVAVPVLVVLFGWVTGYARTAVCSRFLCVVDCLHHVFGCVPFYLTHLITHTFTRTFDFHTHTTATPFLRFTDVLFTGRLRYTARWFHVVVHTTHILRSILRSFVRSICVIYLLLLFYLVVLLFVVHIWLMPTRCDLFIAICPIYVYSIRYVSQLLFASTLRWLRSLFVVPFTFVAIYVAGGIPDWLITTFVRFTIPGSVPIFTGYHICHIVVIVLRFPDSRFVHLLNIYVYIIINMLCQANMSLEKRGGGRKRGGPGLAEGRHGSRYQY